MQGDVLGYLPVLFNARISILFPESLRTSSSTIRFLQPMGSLASNTYGSIDKSISNWCIPTYLYNHIRKVQDLLELMRVCSNGRVTRMTGRTSFVSINNFIGFYCHFRERLNSCPSRWT